MMCEKLRLPACVWGASEWVLKFVMNVMSCMWVGPVFPTSSFLMDVWKWKRSVLICCMDALLSSRVDLVYHKADTDTQTHTDTRTHNNVEMSLVSASCGESWSYQTKWAQQTPASVWLCVLVCDTLTLISNFLHKSFAHSPPHTPYKILPAALVIKGEVWLGSGIINNNMYRNSLSEFRVEITNASSVRSCTRKPPFVVPH